MYDDLPKRNISETFSQASMPLIG